MYRPKKSSEKLPRFKIHLSQYATTKYAYNINPTQKYNMLRKEFYNLQIRLVQFKDEEQTENLHNSSIRHGGY